MMRDSRTPWLMTLRKMESFKTEWEQHGITMVLEMWGQSVEDHADVDDKAGDMTWDLKDQAPVAISNLGSSVTLFGGFGRSDFAPTLLNSCQQTHRQTRPVCTVLPDSTWSGAEEVAFYRNGQLILSHVTTTSWIAVLSTSVANVEWY